MVTFLVVYELYLGSSSLSSVFKYLNAKTFLKLYIISLSTFDWFNHVFCNSIFINGPVQSNFLFIVQIAVTYAEVIQLKMSLRNQDEEDPSRRVINFPPFKPFISCQISYSMFNSLPFPKFSTKIHIIKPKEIFLILR